MPHLQLLVTSRESLRLRWEYELPVPPLRLPDPAGAFAREQLSEVPAVALFLERSRAVQPNLSLTSDNAAAVAEICRRLDGLPLAIELAAAHTKLLPPRALLAELERGPDILEGGASDRPPRHRTMAGAIAWSSELLQPHERAAFFRLSVFAAGCTLTAASDVCGPDTARLIGALVDKNLVRAEESADGQARVVMLQTIRGYALEQLEAAGELASLSARKAAWCLELVERVEREMRGPAQRHWVAQLDAEYDNVRAALTWALDNDELETALRMAGALWRFWSIRGYLLEGQHVLEVALSRGVGRELSLSAAARAKALNAAGELAWERGDMDAARQYHEASLELRRELGDVTGVAQSLQYLGNQALERGEDDLARSLHTEALELARHAELPREMALSLLSLARLASADGDLDAAYSMCAEAAELSGRAGNNVGRGTATRQLGEVALARGEVDRAAELIGESLVLVRDGGSPSTIARTLESLALVTSVRGQLPLVPRLLGCADAIRERARSPLLPTERAFVAPAVALARDRLGESAFRAAWAAGRDLSIDAAVAMGEQGSVPASSAEPLAGRLSPREQEVVALIAQGLTNRQIAERLVMSERTVHAHVRNILDKLGLESRTQVATWAVAAKQQ